MADVKNVSYRFLYVCVELTHSNLRWNFDVLLTVHLSIILAADKLNAQILVL